MSSETPTAPLSAIQKDGKIACQIKEDLSVEPFFFPADVAHDLAKFFDDGGEPMPVTLVDYLVLGEWFSYRVNELPEIYDPDEPVWLEPNRHVACRSIDNLVHELQVTAQRWSRILSILDEPVDAKSQATSDAIGEDLKKDLRSLVRIAQRFDGYEVVEE